MEWVERAMFCLGVFGLITSTVFVGMALAGAARIVRIARREDADIDGRRARGEDFIPAVTVMKPLHGPELRLEPNLRSFFEQDYVALAAARGVAVEFLFCARTDEDGGLMLVRELAKDYPHLNIRTLTSGEPWGPNAKLCSLQKMAEVATTDLWIVSDSDVQVPTDYLRKVVAPFEQQPVGCVTCLYRGVAVEGGLWSRLEAVGMSIEMSAGISVANMMEPMQFALGPTMAVRRECADLIGGFGALVEFCSDDFVLGNKVAAQGRLVELSNCVIDHIILNTSFIDSIKHQVRWMKSTRCSRPKGHLGTSLTFGTPFGLLTFVAAVLLGHPWVGVAALAFSIAGRMLQAYVVGRYVVHEKALARTIVLFPLRDFMGFFFWAMSYSSRRILWRKEVYELLTDGRMRLVQRTRDSKQLIGNRE
jgi:ceramide glucosyltransferase